MGTGVIHHGETRDEGEAFGYEIVIDVFRLSFELKDAKENEFGKPGKEIVIKSLDFEVKPEEVYIKSTDGKQ